MTFGGDYLDIGCDLPPVLVNRVKDQMNSCTGIDVVAEPGTFGRVRIMREELIKKIPLPSRSVDLITMLAVLEHLPYPEAIIRECYRILRRNGRLLLTVPSAQSRPILEGLARLGFVRPEMIKQHETYFTPFELHQLLKQAGFQVKVVKRFELGMNIYAVANKP